MKIKLINPIDNNYKNGFFSTIRIPPIVLGVLAALTPENIEVTIQDEQIEPITYEKVDLVGITVNTHIAKRAYEIAKRYRQFGVKVVLGGIHPTILPDEAIQYSDAVVIGEVETLWKNIVQDAKKGKLKKFYKATKLPSLSSSPAPRRDLFKNNKYVFPNAVYVSRGCPYQCGFCCSSKIYGKYRKKPVKDVIEEIQSLDLKGITKSMIIFLDDALFVDKKYALALFSQLKKLKIKWGAQSTTIALTDKELMKAAAESGCYGLTIGIESFNTKNIESVQKKQNLNLNLKQSIAQTKALGIGIGGLLTFGLDYDTPEMFDSILHTLREIGIGTVSASIIRPYPGTTFYNKLVAEKRVNPKWWLSKHKDAYNTILPSYLMSVYRPKNMNKEQLQEKAVEFLYNYFKFSNIIYSLKFFTEFLSKPSLGVVLHNLKQHQICKKLYKKIKKLKKR
jgi:radical SAM superfamily enzyme YgiQ (UPF0313 family)